MSRRQSVSKDRTELVDEGATLHTIGCFLGFEGSVLKKDIFGLFLLLQFLHFSHSFEEHCNSVKLKDNVPKIGACDNS